MTIRTISHVLKEDKTLRAEAVYSEAIRLRFTSCGDIHHSQKRRKNHTID